MSGGRAKGDSEKGNRIKSTGLNANEMAAKRLASGARTEKELIDFLCKKGIDKSEAEEAAKEFKEDGYIDDLRYSKDYITYGEGKGWGKARIVRELAARGVDSQTIKAAFEERENSLQGFGEFGSSEEGAMSEEDRALKVIEKMMRGSSLISSKDSFYEEKGGAAAGDDEDERDDEDEPFKLDEKTRSRIARRLFSYGYKTADIYGAIKRFENEMNGD